jgi:hypothetical protein
VGVAYRHNWDWNWLDSPQTFWQERLAVTWALFGKIVLGVTIVLALLVGGWFLFWWIVGKLGGIFMGG